MDLETLRNFAQSLPAATEDIKWGNDLCFSIGGKMFLVVGLELPNRFSFKVPDEEFEELSNREGFMPAPYMARAKWVSVETPSRLKKREGEQFIRQSYSLVKAKLTKKAIRELGLT
jgi:predicted DNA-binding protein (MmcQ/YjbR family)